MYRRQELLEKLKEAAASVLPISLIVLAICFVLVPVDTGLMLSFVLATAMLILGMGLFTLGAEMSMSKIGNYMGAKLTKSRKLGLILIVSFLLGVAITVAEPDLQVLAANVPEIDKTVLILTVSVGVGIFLMLCMVRILFGISLRLLLIVFYVLVFLAAFLSDQGILAVAFDSGGVTTGPMTVPFIMALGVGVASIRSDENAKADSFGLVGLCSIGPIASVLLLGAIYKTQPAQAESEAAAAITNAVDKHQPVLRVCFFNPTLCIQQCLRSGERIVISLRRHMSDNLRLVNSFPAERIIGENRAIRPRNLDCHETILSGELRNLRIGSTITKGIR